MGLRFVIAVLVTLLSIFRSTSAACSTSDISLEYGVTKSYTICIGGSTERSYLLFLPRNYAESTTSRSLYLSYHGAGKTAQQQVDLDKLTDPFFNKDAIVVYPEGLDGRWQTVPPMSPADIDFTTQLLTHLQSKLRIDKARIYATGKSEGGGFAGVLACDANTSKLFAAFAPVSGAFYTGVAASSCNPETVAITCNPGRKNIPFIEFHGGADDTILYAGDQRRDLCLPSIPHYLTEWAVRDGLDSHNSTAPFSMDVDEYSFGNGLVRGFFGRKVGHDWPATIPNSDNSKDGHAPTTYNASSVIVDFFSKYTLP